MVYSLNNGTTFDRNMITKFKKFGKKVVDANMIIMTDGPTPKKLDTTDYQDYSQVNQGDVK